MARFHACLIALLLGVASTACGGSGDGGGSPAPEPSPPTAVNPCATAAEEPDASLAATVPPVPRATTAKTGVLDASSRFRVLDALWIHEQQAARAGDRDHCPRGQRRRRRRDRRRSRIEGDVMLPPNPFDLGGTGLRFTRNSGGGYDAQRIDGTFRPGARPPADARRRRQRPGERAVLVQLLRQRADRRVRQLGRQRHVRGRGSRQHRAQRRAAADRTRRACRPFSPTSIRSSGGRVYVNATADQYTVTWCSVRGFESTRLVVDAGDAAAEWHDRDEVRRRRTGRRGGRGVTRPHR